MKLPKDWKPLLRAATRQGWVIVPTKSNHIKLRSRDGKKQISMPSSPSDNQRGLKNMKAQMRRAGIKL